MGYKFAGFLICCETPWIPYLDFFFFFLKNGIIVKYAFGVFIQEDFPHNAHHREIAISISNYKLKHGDTGLVIVGGRVESQPHVCLLYIIQ